MSSPNSNKRLKPSSRRGSAPATPGSAAERTGRPEHAGSDLNLPPTEGAGASSSSPAPTVPDVARTAPSAPRGPLSLRPPPPPDAPRPTPPAPRGPSSLGHSSRKGYWETVLPEHAPPAGESTVVRRKESHGPQTPQPGGSEGLGPSRSTDHSVAVQGPLSVPLPMQGSSPAQLQSSQQMHLSCPICGLHFSHRTFKTNHIQAVHNPGKTYRCRFPGCEKLFAHRSSRSRHETAHRWPKSNDSLE
jgi:hypothetical protein